MARCIVDSPLIVDQRNAGVLLAEGETVLHFDRVRSVRLHQFGFDGVRSAVNRFANFVFVLEEFQLND